MEREKMGKKKETSGMAAAEGGRGFGERQMAVRNGPSSPALG